MDGSQTRDWNVVINLNLVSKAESSSTTSSRSQSKDKAENNQIGDQHSTLVRVILQRRESLQMDYSCLICWMRKNHGFQIGTGVPGISTCA